MSIIDYLPGIPNSFWRDYVKTITPSTAVVLPPFSSDYMLIPDDISNKQGLVLQFGLFCNSSSLEFTLITDTRKITGLISYFYSGGYTSYVPDIPWISRYDTSNNAYTINLDGEIPFRHNVYLYASNPTSSEITISGMAFHAVILEDGFYRELAKLKSGT
jgi:hypothetical protein